MSYVEHEPASGRIVITSGPSRPPQVVRRSRRHSGIPAKRHDPILWSFVVFCAAGVALQTLLLFVGSIRVTLTDVEGALFALGAVVFSPAGLIVGLLGIYVLFVGGRPSRRRRRSVPRLRLR